MTIDLDPFFRPRSVAVVGAGERATSSGGAVMQMLVRGGYPGRLVPVNPKGGTIFGREAATSLAGLDEPAELAVIVVRPDLIPAIVAEAGETGHRNVLILPGGFKEAGEEGLARDRELRRIADEKGVRIAGPNCAGIISIAPDMTFAPTFLADLPLGPDPAKGGVAFLSQSGALAEELIAKSKEPSGTAIGRFALSRVVSVGNAMHLSVGHYVDYLADEEDVSAILLYIESFEDPDRFRATVRRAAARKPVVAMIGGRTADGARAVKAHTGSEAKGDAEVDRFCEACGVIRVKSLRHLLLAAKGFAAYPQGVGRRALILSNSGGPGVVATDRAAIEGLDLRPLPPAMARMIREAVPSEASVANPLDLLADCREERFGLALDAVAAHGREAFETVLMIHVKPLMVDLAPIIATMAAKAGEAGLPILHSVMGTIADREAHFATMEAAGVPMFNDVEAMAECAGLLARYPEVKARLTAEMAA